MRNLYFILTAFFLLFLSCSEGNRNIKAAEQEMINKNDSIEKVKNDSLAQYAWGDAKFGMSVKDVKKTSTFKTADLSSAINDDFRYLYLITNKINNESLILKATFFKNRLYRIDIDSYYKSANYYDTQILGTALSFKHLVEEKYGEPTRDYGFPEFIKMRPDQNIMAYVWDIGDKSIYIDVDEKYSGSEYRATCHIIHNKENKIVDEYFAEKNKNREEVNNF